MRRSDGLARAEEGFGEESAQASAFFFGGQANQKNNKKMLKSLCTRYD